MALFLCSVPHNSTARVRRIAAVPHSSNTVAPTNNTTSKAVDAAPVASSNNAASSACTKTVNKRRTRRTRTQWPLTSNKLVAVQVATVLLLLPTTSSRVAVPRPPMGLRAPQHAGAKRLAQQKLSPHKNEVKTSYVACV